MIDRRLIFFDFNVLFFPSPVALMTVQFAESWRWPWKEKMPKTKCCFRAKSNQATFIEQEKSCKKGWSDRCPNEKDCPEAADER